MNSRISKKKNR